MVPPLAQDFRCGHTNLVILKSLSHKLVGVVTRSHKLVPLKAGHSGHRQIRFTGAVLISVRRFQVNAPAIADAIAVLCRWGRRLCPSHVIACKYKIRFTGAVLISVRRFQVLGNRPEKKERRASIP